MAPGPVWRTYLQRRLTNTTQGVVKRGCKRGRFASGRLPFDHLLPVAVRQKYVNSGPRPKTNHVRHERRAGNCGQPESVLYAQREATEPDFGSKKPPPNSAELGRHFVADCGRSRPAPNAVAFLTDLNQPRDSAPSPKLWTCASRPNPSPERRLQAKFRSLKFEEFAARSATFDPGQTRPK